MSTATEISRLTDARNTIRDKLIALGLATSTSKLDALATAVDGITNRGAVSATVQEGDTYTIPAGYHNGSGTVSGVAGGGNYSLQSKTATPTKSQQSITPDSGYYGLSDVTVNPIPEAYQNVSSVTAGAGDVLTGKIIVSAAGTSIAGTMANNGAVNKTLDATNNNQTYTIPTGYHSGSGQVKISLETKTATPTKSSQDITPTTGKVLSKVTVNPIPAAYQDVTNVDATAADVLTGKTFVAADGTETAGAMPAITAANTNLVSGNPTPFEPGTGISGSGYGRTIPAGYHDGAGFDYVLTETKTATPTKNSQDITPTSGKVLSKVTVAAIPSAYQDVTSVDAVAGDVKTGKTFVASDGTEVAGTMPINAAADHNVVVDGEFETDYDTVAYYYWPIPAGYHDGNGTAFVNIEAKTATPTVVSQTIRPSQGKLLNGVTVNAIPAVYGDTTGDTAVAANLLAGVKAHTISNGSATRITGTMANNGAISGTIDGITITSYSVPSGYTSGGTVSLTNDIETALAAI